MWHCARHLEGARGHDFYFVSAHKKHTVKIKGLKETHLCIHVLRRVLNNRIQNVGDEKYKTFAVFLVFPIVVPLCIDL